MNFSTGIEWTDATANPVRFRDRDGGDPAKWPEDLRVREMPRGDHDGGR